MELPPAEPHVHSAASEDMRRAFEAQRAAFARGAPGYRDRMDALAALRDELHTRARDFVDALAADFGGRAREETLLIDVFQTSEMINHTRRRLKRWMKPKRVGSKWYLLPSRTYVVPQPLGVVGIISPWNYPVVLSLGPLVDALAAGNHVMIKPSEMVPRTAEVLADMIRRVFPPEYVTIILGDEAVGSEFAALPFDHLLFTGSSRVGAMVMKAAAENLTPVTLELSGKSPAIVHGDFSLELAASRLFVGKLYNSGQSCIAPDYLLLPRGREAEFEQVATRVVTRMYPSLVANPDYTRILRGYGRIERSVADAESRGARVVRINPANEECNATNRVFPPTLVFQPADDAIVLTEENFGPVLPVVSYDTLDDAIAFVNRLPKPLALYYFDDDTSRIEDVVRRTASGAVGINECVLQHAQLNIPFGGIGLSGIGQYHGEDGFHAFSKKRGIMVQRRWTPVALMRAPYVGRSRALIELLVRLSRR
jgi:coniferyl-aldehyde dehydrogenase